MTTSLTPIPDPDDAPEAPSPRPPLTLYMRVAENGAAHNYEGGTVVLVAAIEQRDDVSPLLSDGRLVLASPSNQFLETFPWKSRAAKQQRFFRVDVTEIPADQVPPDPRSVQVALYDEQGRRRKPDGSLVIPIQMKPAVP